MAKLTGLKAQAKRFLRAKGIKKVVSDTGVGKNLARAKTINVVKAAISNGWK